MLNSFENRDKLLKNYETQNVKIPPTQYHFFKRFIDAFQIE